MSNAVVPVLPSLRMNDYDQKQVVDYLSLRHARNKNLGFGVCQYTHGASVTANGYVGGVYSPTQNRIYLVPWAQSSQSSWHYIDCSTGNVVAYAHGATVVANAYYGGVYSPTQDRIYFIPATQADQSSWHYVDCKTGLVVAYSQNSGLAPLSGAYRGGSYSPAQNRIYLSPYVQANQADWHYIDCSNGNVVSYPTGQPVEQYAYVGALYSPLNNRIYLIPAGITAVNQWHYIDCSSGAVVPYDNGSGYTVTSNGYHGGVYSPTQDRIYLIPNVQADQTYWHYIDCAAASVVQYANGVSAPSGAYLGGSYSPAQNRVIFAPNGPANPASMHYIDCNSGAVGTFTSGVSMLASAYRGSAYSPTQNRVYFIPFAQAGQTTWHYIQEYSAADVSPALMASTLFNTF